MKILKAQSYWIKKPNKGYIKSHPIDYPTDKQLLVKTIYSGISFGTEKIVYDGKVPASQVELMRCPHQEGIFGKDIKYGYINVGKVIMGNNKYLGKNIFSLYPHQTKYVIDNTQVTVIPKEIPLKRCLLIPNMETAINGIWDTLPTLGDKVAIIGAGVVGCLTAYLVSRLIGSDVILIDTNIKKKSIAKKLNIPFYNLLPKNYFADIIFECSGNSDVLNSLQKNVNYESKICILSWYGNQISKIKMGEEFFSKRTNIKFSQVSRISESRLSNWNHNKRRELAINMLNEKKLDILVEKKMINFDQLPSFFNTNISKSFMCKAVKY